MSLQQTHNVAYSHIDNSSGRLLLVSESWVDEVEPGASGVRRCTLPSSGTTAVRAACSGDALVCLATAGRGRNRKLVLYSFFRGVCVSSDGLLLTSAKPAPSISPRAGRAPHVDGGSSVRVGKDDGGFGLQPERVQSPPTAQSSNGFVSLEPMESPLTWHCVVAYGRSSWLVLLNMNSRAVTVERVLFEVPRDLAENGVVFTGAHVLKSLVLLSSSDGRVYRFDFLQMTFETPYEGNAACGILQDEAHSWIATQRGEILLCDSAGVQRSSDVGQTILRFERIGDRVFGICAHGVVFCSLGDDPVGFDAHEGVAGLWLVDEDTLAIISPYGRIYVWSLSSFSRSYHHPLTGQPPWLSFALRGMRQISIIMGGSRMHFVALGRYGLATFGLAPLSSHHASMTLVDAATRCQSAIRGKALRSMWKDPKTRHILPYLHLLDVALSRWRWLICSVESVADQLLSWVSTLEGDHIFIKQNLASLVRKTTRYLSNLYSQLSSLKDPRRLLDAIVASLSKSARDFSMWDELHALLTKGALQSLPVCPLNLIPILHYHLILADTFRPLPNCRDLQKIHLLAATLENYAIRLAKLQETFLPCHELRPNSPVFYSCIVPSWQCLGETETRVRLLVFKESAAFIISPPKKAPFLVRRGSTFAIPTLRVEDIDGRVISSFDGSRSLALRYENVIHNLDFKTKEDALSAHEALCACSARALMTESDLAFVRGQLASVPTAIGCILNAFQHMSESLLFSDVLRLPLGILASSPFVPGSLAYSILQGVSCPEPRLEGAFNARDVFEAILMWLYRLPDPLLKVDFASQVLRKTASENPTALGFFLRSSLLPLGGCIRNLLTTIFSLVGRLCVGSGDIESERRLASFYLATALYQVAPEDLAHPRFHYKLEMTVATTQLYLEFSGQLVDVGPEAISSPGRKTSIPGSQKLPKKSVSPSNAGSPASTSRKKSGPSSPIGSPASTSRKKSGRSSLSSMQKKGSFTELVFQAVGTSDELSTRQSEAFHPVLVTPSDDGSSDPDSEETTSHQESTDSSGRGAVEVPSRRTKSALSPMPPSGDPRRSGDIVQPTSVGRMVTRTSSNFRLSAAFSKRPLGNDRSKERPVVPQLALSIAPPLSKMSSSPAILSPRDSQESLVGSYVLSRLSQGPARRASGSQKKDRGVKRSASHNLAPSLRPSRVVGRSQMSPRERTSVVGSSEDSMGSPHSSSSTRRLSIDMLDLAFGDRLKRRLLGARSHQDSWIKWSYVSKSNTGSRRSICV